MTIPDSLSLEMNGGSTLTMMAWVSVMPCPEPDSGYVNRGTVLGKTGEYEHSVTCGSAPNYQEAIATTANKDWADQPGFPISTSTWHHVATTWDAQTVYQYIDGVEVGSRPLTGNLSPTAVFGVASGVGIGCGNVDATGSTGSDAYWFVGAIDEVALYDRALSATEIQNYYAATSSCLSDLSSVGAADFHISFTLATDAGAVDMALLNQRMGCDETSTWWDVSYIPSTGTTGGLTAATDDGTHYVIAEQATGGAVDDGKPHRIVVARTSGQLGFSVDGVAAAGPAADPYSFGPMPPLQIGTDECPGFGPTIGSITNLCITTP